VLAREAAVRLPSFTWKSTTSPRKTFWSTTPSRRSPRPRPGALRELHVLGPHRDEHLVVGASASVASTGEVADLGAHAVVALRRVGAEHRAIDEVGAADEVGTNEFAGRS
jgi:hypothetical protein